MASRVAASQLLTIGVPELVTFDPAEYEARAIELAVDPRRLEALREKLRVGRKESPLFDMARYVRGFEDALATAWDEHQRGSAPATS
jgi:predicted O-linked N-acetylglucosamine transferase (SPINDLY family)